MGGSVSGSFNQSMTIMLFSLIDYKDYKDDNYEEKQLSLGWNFTTLYTT